MEDLGQELTPEGEGLDGSTGQEAGGAVSYTHLPSPRDQRGSRMPSSA